MLTESLPGLTHSRGDDRRHVQIFLLTLASLPVLRAVSRGTGSSFCFDEEDNSCFFSPQLLALDTEAFGCSLKAPLPNPLQSKEYRSQDKGWRIIAEASALAAR